MTLTAAIGALTVAGCGGSGENPPATETQVPVEFTYPAYRAVSEDGDELFIQIKKTGDTVAGHFTFFLAQAETDTDIIAGPVEGAVGTDGTVQLKLFNPYDPEAPPFETEGVQNAEGWLMHDVETPEDVVQFTPYEAPTTRGLFGTKARIYIKEVDQHINIDNKGVPHWLLPLSYLCGQRSETSTSVVNADDRLATATLHSWGNGWSWINLHKGLDRTAVLWVKCNPTEVDLESRPIAASSFYLNQHGVMVTATGTIGPIPK
ncbi:MAG: hypothetical protein ACO1SV_24120 [Fimbriimonas sp.]